MARLWGMSVAVALVMAAGGGAAFGQEAPEGDPAEERAADRAFREGRELMAQEKYAEACAKFEESFRLDPANGTLLNMADCHEKLGKLATALAEFERVAELSDADGQAVRAKEARRRADLLRPRVPSVRIEVAERPAGLKVLLDDEDVTGRVGEAIPVDPGTHVVAVRATEREEWRGEVSAEGEGETAAVEVPALSPVQVQQPEQNPLPPRPPESDPDPVGTDDGRGLRIAGLATAGGGVLVAVAGGLLLAHANGQASDLEEEFAGGGTWDQEAMDRESAYKRNQRLGVAMTIVGTAALATGGTLWFLGRRAGAKESRVTVGPTGDGGGMVVWSGSF